jgi:hypothetical protein
VLFLCDINFPDALSKHEVSSYVSVFAIAAVGFDDFPDGLVDLAALAVFFLFKCTRTFDALFFLSLTQSPGLAEGHLLVEVFASGVPTSWLASPAPTRTSLATLWFLADWLFLFRQTQRFQLVLQ